MSSRSALLLFAAAIAAAAAAGCDERRDPGAGPGPVPALLELRFDDPVIARFVQSTSIFVAEFAVTVRDPNGPGGTLEFLETIVINRSRSVVIVANRRPNASFSFPDTFVPAGGSIMVEAGAGFAPPPPRDEIVVTVRVRLSDGREVERTAALTQQFGPPS